MGPAQVAGRSGIPRESRHRAGHQRGRGARVLPQKPGAPRCAALRHRRRGGEGELVRAAGGHGLHGPRAALGHRVQVPARGEDHAFARYHRAGGAHGQANAGGGDGPGAGGGLDRGPRHAAQRGRGAAQGRARGRHGHRAQGRRRDPRGAGPRAQPASGRFAALEHAQGVPKLRQPRGSRGRRGRLPLHFHRLPCSGA